jgi:hypothetical protein
VFHNIISITGNKGSGKDTVADYLCKKYEFTKFAFADPIKCLAQDIFDFDMDDLWGPSENRDIPNKKYPIKCPECHGSGAYLIHYDEEDDGVSFVECPVCGGDGIHSYLIPRTVLQKFGDAGRACYPDIWAEKTIRDIQEQNNFIKNAIVSDCRMKNEMAIVKKNGGKTIRIKRKNLINTSTHSSETEQLEIPDSDFDYVINNDSTLEDLEKEIDKCMQALGIT